MFEFKLINPEMSELWDQMMDLRFAILRQPWGETKGSETASDDNISIHGIILNEAGVLIGTCRSHLVEEGVAQFRFMAVSKDYQGKGIGKKLVEYMEETSITDFKQLQKIVLHAREPAVPFYKTLNYKVIKPTYLLFGSIQHFFMEKSF
jgi:N-acetylglutamate synthase-like GNAT family acetyltransferase